MREDGIIGLLRRRECAIEPPKDSDRPELYRDGAISYFDRHLEILAVQNAVKKEPEWCILMLWDPTQEKGFMSRNISTNYERK